MIQTWGFPGGTSSQESSCQCRRCKRLGFDPWVGKIPWSRKWQPTPVVFPGEFHGERSLAGYSPRGCRELDMTEHACTRDPDTVASLQGLVYRSSHQLFWSLPQQQLENRSVNRINSCFPTGVWKCQCSCLENPRDGAAWWAAIYGAAQSRTRPKWLSSSSSSSNICLVYLFPSFYLQHVFLLFLCCLVTKSCLILCNPMDCSPPGSSVHVSLQARILEWVAISFFIVSL